jgi:hypothetical protein
MNRTAPIRAKALTLALTIAGVAMLLLAPGASATKYVHRVVAQGNGTLQGQWFGQVSGIAVNRSAVADNTTDPLGGSTDGYVYVVETGNSRVQVFDSAGVFQFTFGGGVKDGAVAPQVCTRNQTPCTARVDGTRGGMFSSPSSVAIDQDSGNLFVRDKNNRRVQEFEADGTFLRAWGWNVVQEGTSGDTAADQFETCFVAAECQAGVSGASPGQFATASFGYGGGIDVHGPSGDVLVADPENSRIQRFEVPTNTSAPIPAPGAANMIGPIPAYAGFPGIFSALLAVDDSGIVYAPAGGGGNDILRYNLNTSAFIDPIPVASLTGTDPLAETVALEVDPTNGNLLAARRRFIVELADPDGPVGSITHVDTHLEGALDFSGSSGVQGMGLDPESGNLYVASNPYLLLAKDGPASPATVTFQPHSNVEGITATVSATISRDEALTTEYQLQFANSNTPGDFVTVASGQIAPGSGSVLVTSNLEDLLPSNLYLVRMVTQKPFGNPQTFTSAPTLATKVVPPSIFATRAGAITDSSARLSVSINPNGRQTSYHFEYGVGNFANFAPLPDGLLNSSNTQIYIEQAISGLQPNTTYQYRVVASSGIAGTETGPTQTFTTKAAPELSEERAYELVSPADKIGGAGVGEWYTGPSSLANSGLPAYSGERFAAQGSFGSMLLDGPFAYANDWAFADRIDDQRGWVSHSALASPNLGPAFASFFGFLASSEDLSRFVVQSNNTLLLFPELTGPAWKPAWNLPSLLSWGGPDSASRREFFGPTDPALIDPGASSGVWVSKAIADGGSRMIAMTELASGGTAAVRGVAGPTDPTKAGFNDLVAGRSIYTADTSAEPTNTFAGSGRELVNVCSGTAGTDRTLLPAVNGSGDMGAAECAVPQAGRSERLISDRGASLHGVAATVALPEDVVSANGRRVFFLSPDPVAAGVPDGLTGFCTASGQTCPPQLYVRQFNEDGSKVTRWISRSTISGQDASLTGTARFEGASADGDKVFFRTNSPLTADDPNGTGPTAPAGGVKTGSASSSSWDLYMLDLAPGNDPTGPGSTLTRISAGSPGGDDGDCNAPYNGDGTLNATQSLRFASDDGSRVYFTCAKPLPGVSGTPAGAITTPAGGTSPATQANLYLYDANLPAATAWRFVTQLPRSVVAGLDACASTGYNPSGPIASPAQEPQFRLIGSAANCVRGNSDGSFLTFFTSGRLTIDDPKTPLTGDVYAYEADRNELTRVSASQGGVGGTYACAPGSSALPCNGDGGVGEQSSAGSINSPLGLATNPLTPDDHVAFFASASKLVSADTDTAYDVYEWHDGKLNLLTPGTSEDALYKGNDRSGRNVFFASREPLTWQDTDDVGDIYTARVGGGIAEPLTPPACDVLADGCQGAPVTSPVPRGASSAVLSGAGNVVEPKKPKRCAKGEVRKSERCVKKKSKKKKKNHKKAGKSGRAGR